MLENNFDDFIPDVYNGVYYNKYGFSLAHFNPNINNGVEEYKRRMSNATIIKKVRSSDCIRSFVNEMNKTARELNIP